MSILLHLNLYKSCCAFSAHSLCNSAAHVCTIICGKTLHAPQIHMSACACGLRSESTLRFRRIHWRVMPPAEFASPRPSQHSRIEQAGCSNPGFIELSKLHVLIPAGVRTSSLAVFIPVRKKDPLGTLGAHVSMRSRLQSRRWARNTHEIIGVSNPITLIPARRTYSHGVFGPFIGENQSHYIVSYILHAGPFVSLFIQRRYSAGF